MRVALYARVSTERQERERTIGSQVEALEARAAAEGRAVELSCADNGHSGARLDRPGLDQVRDAAAARRIDAVVALCPDRLARNYVHQALVPEELARFGVSVIFLEGGHADDPQRAAARANPGSGGRVRAHEDRRPEPPRQALAGPSG